MNWGPIQQMYFPNKSANACRKRHERLMSKKSAATCSGRRLEKIAHSYVGLRKETWTPIAAQTGEKWYVVEQKVCSSKKKEGVAYTSVLTSCQILSEGLKNIQLSARAHARRLAAAGGQEALRAYEDSGVSGIDDLEAEYEDGSSNHSSSASGLNVYGQYPDHSHNGQLSAGMYHSSGHVRNMSHTAHGQVGSGHHSSRLSSIDSIINGHDGRQ